jgi:hypothetical protein
MVVAIWCCGLAGCVEWSEDSHGNLRSLGLPGVPLWTSKAPPAPPTPAEMGYTPEEASRMSGPILVVTPDASIKTYRYRYYQTGENKCQEDLQKILAERTASNATGPAPYCTAAPSASSASAPPPSPPPPPAAKGNEFVF